MKIKKNDVKQLREDLKYVGGLIKLLQDYGTLFNELNMTKRLKDDLELITKIYNYTEREKEHLEKN